MAYLVRPWQVRYVKDGKRVPKGTPGAKRKKQRARKWYGCKIPGLPKGKRVPLASDKTVAQQLLAELVRKGERGEARLEDTATEAARVPLSKHLADFASALRAKDTSEKQVNQTLQRCRDTFNDCGFTLPRDIDAEAVMEYLHERRGKPKADGGLSSQTSNFYLAAVSQFCRWMVKRKRMAENAMLGAQRSNPKLDRRHDRRNLRPEELSRLLDVVRAGDRTFRGLTPEDRYWLYLAGCGTGFRKMELYSLTPESFALDADPPAVTVAARTEGNKKKKQAVQPVPACLVPGLREYLAGKRPGEKVWPGTWPDRAADMLKDDLADAGIPYEVKGPDGPLYVDFHALRHTYVTFLEQSGASMKEAQGLARHGDIRLTMDRYAHVEANALARAADRLPLPVGDDGRLVPADPLAQLVAAFLLQQAVLGTLLPTPAGALVAPRVAPGFEFAGDGPGRQGTGDSGTAAA